jgi:pyoverdine/dityrosine biosynthesis protein Dit1
VPRPTELANVRADKHNLQPAEELKESFQGKKHKKSIKERERPLIHTSEALSIPLGDNFKKSVRLDIYDDDLVCLSQKHFVTHIQLTSIHL